MCSNLLFLKWKIWSMTWDVVLQELLLTCLDLQKEAYLDSWALWASPRGTLRVCEVFPLHPCWAPLFTAWLMQWRWVFSCSFDHCASLWDLGLRVRIQKPGSVLGKQSWLWGTSCSRCMIPGHCSWEWDGFCSLAGGKRWFSLCLSWSYHWHCCESWPYVSLKGLAGLSNWHRREIVHPTTAEKKKKSQLRQQDFMAWEMELFSFIPASWHLFHHSFSL